MKTRKFLLSAIAAAMLAHGAAAWADEPFQRGKGAGPSPEGMLFDLFLIRPIALAGTVLGAGVFVVFLPLSIIDAEVPAQAAETLVVGPFKYTFLRRLGE